MKFILSLLAILFSTNFLFSQAERRLEEADQRLKAINQGIEVEMVELSSKDLSFQIDQGVKSTTNYEPPITNCSNQGDDLDYYLMMNSSTVEDAGKTEFASVFKKSAEISARTADLVKQARARGEPCQMPKIKNRSK